MLKFTATMMTFLILSLQAQAQVDQYGYEPQQPARPHELPQWERSHYNYFKASMGSSSLDDHKDSSGELRFEGSSVLPINLGYGISAGNVSFEGELGFGHNDFEFAPSDVSADAGFGDLSSSKLMFNAFYKTSATDSNFYIGGGIGLVAVSLDGIEQELTGSSLATQFIVGGEVRTNEKSGIFLEYRNLQSVGLEIENDFAEIDYEFKESSFNLGLRFYF